MQKALKSDLGLMFMQEQMQNPINCMRMEGTGYNYQKEDFAFVCFGMMVIPF